MWEVPEMSTRPIRALATLCCAAAAIGGAAVLLAAPAGTNHLVSRPAGFGPVSSPTTNHSYLVDQTGGGGEGGARLVADVQNQRYIAFVSEADGISAEDDNSVSNVYVRDRAGGTTILVSRADGPTGAGANGSSSNPSISANGRWVAFESRATNLSDADEGGVSHVFLRDIFNGETRLVDRADGAAGVIANDVSRDPSVTVVGNSPVVAFTSFAENLDGPVGVPSQIYVRNGANDDTAMVSRRDNPDDPGNGFSSDPEISTDGDAVVFQSEATNLTAVNDANNNSDIYIRRRGAGTTTLVSGFTPTANGDSTDPSVDAGGTRIAFTTQASDLAACDSDTDPDVVVRDMGIGIVMANCEANGVSEVNGTEGDKPSFHGSINDAGTQVVFSTASTNLIAGDTNGVSDIYSRGGLFNALSMTTGRVSRVGLNMGVVIEADGPSYLPSIARNPQNNATSIAFETAADNMGANDDDDFQQIYAWRSGIVVVNSADHISRPTGTAPFASGVNSSYTRSPGRDSETARSTSADGRYVAFVSVEDDLAADDDDRVINVYRRDNLTGETVLVSRADGAAGVAANGDSAIGATGPVVGLNPRPFGAPSISADGRRIAFPSAATNLVPNDVNAASDIFVRDVVAGTTTLASVQANGSPIAAPSNDPSLSGDGLRVAFVTAASLDGQDAGNDSDVYLRDLAAGTTLLVSRRGPAGPSGNGPSGQPAADFAGNHVAFTTDATDMNPVFTDANGDSDVWVRDVAAGQTTLVSRAGAATAAANQPSYGPAVSTDANRVAFTSKATNLGATGDINGPVDDVFVRDVGASTTTLVSRTTGPTGISGNSISGRASISADGTRIAFETNAGDLVPGDGNGHQDVLLRDTAAQTTELVSVGPAGQANGPSDSPALSGDGNCVAFMTTADNLVTMPPGTDHWRVVMRALRGDCPFGPVAEPSPTPPPGSPPPPPGSSPPASVAGTAAPVVSGVRLSPRRFRAGVRVAAARKGKPPTGGRLRFTLSAAARVTVPIDAVLPGRRSGKRCVAPRPTVKGRACTRFVRKGALSVAGKLGVNTVNVTGRVAGKLLAPGRYRGTISAVDAAGRRSAPRTVSFTVLPR